MNFLINSFLPFPSSGNLTDNLVFYIRGNNSVADEVGNFTPLGTAISYANGVYSGTANESILFNSTSDIITISDSNLLSFGNASTDSPFSFSLALNSTSFAAGQSLFRKRIASSGREYECTINTSGAVQLFLFDESASAAYIGRRATTTLSTSTNHHVVVTYDGGGVNTGIKIYIDGSESSGYTNLSSGTYTAMENLNEDFTIGLRAWDSTQPFVGRMDGIGLWDIELSSAQVSTIYTTQSGGTELL